MALWGSAEDNGASSFRTIHYLGSKLRLLPDIEREIEARASSEAAVCDLFSGSGVVGAHLARHRRVVAVDIQEYSRVLASALLNPAPLSEETALQVLTVARELHGGAAPSALASLAEHEARCIELASDGHLAPLCDVLEYGSVASFVRGRRPENELETPLSDVARRLRAVGSSMTGEPPIAEYFGGVYFSYRQAIALQCALAATREVMPRERDTALAAILSAASELVTTVGNHFAQPIRPRDRSGAPKRAVVLSVAKKRSVDALTVIASHLDRYRNLPPAAHHHEAIQGDYRTFLASYESELAAIYADPPYTRDHYSRGRVP